MTKAVQIIDLVVSGETIPVPLIVDKNASNEVAVARAIYADGDLVGDANPLPVNFTTLPAGTNALGSVSVSNFPATQPVSLGSLPPLATGTNEIGSVNISNFPATQPVSLSTLPAGTNALGSVSVSNFPATQAVSLGSLPPLATGSNAIGSVTVSNFPSTQPVSLSTLPAGTNALGSVSVSNFPATQPVSLTTLPPLATGANTIGSVDLRVNSAAVANANPLPVLSTPPTTGIAGETTVPTAGTFVSLGTGALTRGVNIRALFGTGGNTGIIRVRYVGNSTTTGYQLGAGDAIWLEADNLNRIQIDATVNNNGVSYIGN